MSERPTTRWRRDPRVLWRRFGSELVLLPSDAEECVRVSGSAWPVWRHLAEPRTEAELCAALSAEFGAEETSIAGDVAALIEALATQRVIEVEGAGWTPPS